MAKEIYPSSYECDCGHKSDFFENTIDEMKRTSKKKKLYLSDSDKKDEHTIVFYKGEATEIVCPKLGKCTITTFE